MLTSEPPFVFSSAKILIERLMMSYQKLIFFDLPDVQAPVLPSADTESLHIPALKQRTTKEIKETPRGQASRAAGD
ncbi:MAG TPA: hypothetical protein DCR87_06055 [Acidobacteria bacterium]|nr:hypothetical protein [Acidobacteriota bacterium]